MHTDRGDLSAPLIVDALGWRRVLGGSGFQPPDAPLSRGLEVHPSGSGDEMAIWIDRSYVPAGYGWSFPAGGELRIGVGSFDPRYHVKDSTVELARDVGSEAVRYQGNWIPHKLREATEDGVFFVGDSAGHCLPLTAEGIRTAFYFGIAAGRELRAVVAGQRTAAEALQRYGAFSASHKWKFEAMLARPAAGAEGGAARARAGAQGSRVAAVRALVVRALPADRAAGVRRGAAATSPARAQASPPPSRRPARAGSGSSCRGRRPSSSRRRRELTRPRAPGFLGETAQVHERWRVGRQRSGLVSRRLARPRGARVAPDAAGLGADRGSAFLKPAALAVRAGDAGGALP